MGRKPWKIKQMTFRSNIQLLRTTSRSWKRSDTTWAEFDAEDYGIRIYLKGIEDEYILVPWPVIDRVVIADGYLEGTRR